MPHGRRPGPRRRRTRRPWRCRRRSRGRRPGRAGSGRVRAGTSTGCGVRGARPGVVRVRPGQHREHGGRVGDVAGEHADAVERAAGREHAAGADEPAGRLQPDDPVHRGRHPARAGGVGAQGEGDDPGGDGDGAARARPAGDQIAAEHALGSAVRGAGAVEAGGELVEVGLADDDRAGGEQPGDAGGVPVRGVGERRAGGRGGEPGDVDVVLDGAGHGVERQLRRHRRQLVRPGPQRRGLGARDPDGVVAARREPGEHGVDDVVRARTVAETGCAGQGLR